MADPRAADPLLAADGTRHGGTATGCLGRLPGCTRAHVRHDRQRPHHRRRDPHRGHSQLVGARRAEESVVGSHYDAKTASGSRAVEIVTPAVSSPPMFSSQAQRDVATMLEPLARHLKFLEGDSRGYVLLDVTPKTLQADWYSCRRSPSARTRRSARRASSVSAAHLISCRRDKSAKRSDPVTAMRPTTAATRPRPCGRLMRAAGSRWRSPPRPPQLSLEADAAIAASGQTAEWPRAQA